MVNTLIVYAHPYEGSFNHEVLNVLVKRFEEENRSFKVLDLYGDHFDGQYTSDELRLYRQGKTAQRLVTEYQSQLLNCQNLVLVFPIWWNDVPAIIKGFVDMVVKKGMFYEPSKYSVVGKLSGLKEVEAITTSTSPTWYLKLFCGNAIKSVLLRGTFKQLGAHKVKWENFDRVGSRSKEECETYLRELSRHH